MIYFALEFQAAFFQVPVTLWCIREYGIPPYADSRVSIEYKTGIK